MCYSVVLGHFGPGLAMLIAAAFASQSPLLLLITFFVASFLAMPLMLSAEKLHPCVDLPPPSFKQNMKAMAHIFLTAIVAGTAVIVGGWWLLQQIPFPLDTSPGLCFHYYRSGIYRFILLFISLVFKSWQDYKFHQALV